MSARKSRSAAEIRQGRVIETPRVRVLGWEQLAILQLVVEGHGKRLQIVVHRAPGIVEWQVVANEIGKDVLTLDAALGAHAHENLGIHRGLKNAIFVAEEYAETWQRKKLAKSKCGCESISSPTSKGRKP